jgi:hypothetical protein
MPFRKYENNIIWTFLYILDILLTALLSPFIIWQWLSKQHHLMIILKTVFEVIINFCIISFVLKSYLIS